MGKPEKPSPDATHVPKLGTSLLLLGTIGETTWRMFTPVLILLVLGIWLDGKTGHKPLFTLGGVIVGFGLSIALIAQQLKRINDSDKGKKD